MNPGRLLMPLICLAAHAGLAAPSRDPAQTASEIEKGYVFKDDVQKNYADFAVRELRVPVQPTPVYEPVMATFAAGLESRNYESGQWTNQDLEWPDQDKKDEYYAKPVRAHVKLKSSEGGFTVILGSSFSTWQRGTWVNKAVALIQRRHPNRNFIVFPGFLTPESLSQLPKRPDISGEQFSKDIYRRLRAFFNHLPSGVSTKDVNIVGFSGGAALALAMVAVDEANSQKTHAKPLFKRAISFSPVLDLKTSLRILDEGRRKAIASGVPQNKWLTTFGTEVTHLLSFNGHLTVLADAVDDPAARKQAEFTKGLFYNEFTVVDLRKVAKSSMAVGFDLPLSQENFFEKYAFARLQKEGLVGPHETFESYTDMRRLISKIQIPTLIVFAQDDPVLSKLDYKPESAPSPGLQNTLAACRQNKNVTLFNPKYGSHLGYFLDSEWVTETLDFLFH